MQLLKTFILSLAIVNATKLNSQNELVLTLNSAIKLATDSSIAKFKAENTYLINYWEYNSLIQQKKPYLNLTATPFTYNKSMVKRYDSENNIDVYRQQTNVNSYANLQLGQNITKLGGLLYFDSDLGYLQNFSDRSQLFSATPFRVGYKQNIFGYNSFKWDYKISTIKYEKSQKDFLAQIEEIAIKTVECFFQLALATENLEISKTNFNNAIQLLKFGEERFKIAAILEEEFQKLKLNKLTTEIELSKAQIGYLKAQVFLNYYLKIPIQTKIKLDLPVNISNIKIESAEAISKMKQNNPLMLNKEQKMAEAKQNFEKIKFMNRFNANIDISYGYNQSNQNFNQAYLNPLPQERVTLNLNIPILNSSNKAKFEQIKKTMKLTEVTTQQDLNELEQETIIKILEFNIQESIVKNSLLADSQSTEAYVNSQENYILGKVSLIDLYYNRAVMANSKVNYLESLKNYWVNFFLIRKLTLYDFENGRPLSYDFKNLNKQ